MATSKNEKQPMKAMKKKVRALGLCSGGLDSILSGLVLRQQGIAVEWVSFETPFFNAAKARKASEMTGIPLDRQTHLQRLYKNVEKSAGRIREIYESL